MENFEGGLGKLVDKETRDLLGAVAFVVNSKGDVLYSHSAGCQSLDPKSLPLDPKSTLSLVSAGKFITHIALLQLVERQLITIDDPIYKLVPELEHIQVIQPSSSPGGPGYELVPRAGSITFRHVLSNSSGIGSEEAPLIQKWHESTPEQTFPPETSPILRVCSSPLLFQPGHGWYYGHDVHLLQLLIERATGTKFTKYIQENIFDVLGMKQSTYLPHQVPEVLAGMLEWVERGEDGKLSVVPGGTIGGLTCSVPDIQSLLVDLVSAKPKLLNSKQSLDMLFGPALQNDEALTAFRAEAHSFAGAPANIPKDHPSPTVNYSVAGAMYIQSDDLLSPKGTLCWDGMPNVAWALNRDKGLGMFFGTQLLPEYDDKTLQLMKKFFNQAWKAFG